ncbi:MAG TPA: FAD-binding oxidoreductase, partial [Euzebyales bacterium]|nr:FAD-binding oxidoreductase [Euzebyales bacterium]
MIDRRPAVIARCTRTADVAAAVRFAVTGGMEIGVHGGGHSVRGLCVPHGGLMVDLSTMRGVQVDPDRRRARVQGGALLSGLDAATQQAGLATTAGIVSHTGVGGLTLGGGMGWLARQLGLACDNVVSFEVVAADGTVLRASESENADLFWGLRGGGGNFGVVTAIEFELYPVSELAGGALLWPAERAEEIFNAWREWAATVPTQVTSLCRLLNVPSLPDVPEPLRGRSFVAVEAAILGDDAVLAPLRALAPEIDMVGPIAPAALIEIHNDPKQPMPGLADHRILADAGPEAIAALGNASGPELVAVELRHLGGNLPVDGFSLFAIGVPMDAESAMAIDAALARVMAATAPYDSGRSLANFSD